MKITAKQNAIHVDKATGIKVDYYLFDEYEVHYNEQPPKSTQEWHHHETIWETLYIIEGELVAKWKENGEEKFQIVKAGDIIETEHTPHTFENKTETVVKFLVFKQVLSGENKRELLKTDKILE